MLNSFPRDIAGGSPPDPAPGRDPRDVDFGLVIGVDHDPRFRSLRGAVTDATRFHEWLCEDRGGGVAPQRARLIKSRPDPIAPLQDEVDDKLLELVTAADAIGGGRRLYFPWELSIEAGLYKLEDSAGKAMMFDHGGEAVTRVVF